MDWGVHVVLCMYTWKYTQPSHFGKKWGCLSVWLGGWVEKNGDLPGKKGGRPGKTPARWGKMGGGPWREGRDPPGGLGEPMERTRLYGARRDASGRGDGNSSIQHAPVALRYPKSLPGGIGEYLGAPGCTHTTTHPPVCTCGDRYLSVPRPTGASRLPILAAGNRKFPDGNPFAMRARELRRACEGFCVPLPWEFLPRFPHPLWPVPPLAVCNVSRHRLPWWIR